MRTTLSVVVLVATLAACGKQPDVPKPGTPQGRPETENLRNVEALGYSGAAIAGKVDGALDANDQRKAELDSAIEAQSEPR